MAIGDDAAAAGIPLVAGTLPANQIDTAINQLADEVARRTADVAPITKGGTGATTASAARTNLEITPANVGAVPAASLAPGNIAIPNAVPTYNAAGQLTAVAPTLPGHVVDLGTLQAGFTVAGHIYLPGSTPATSGYTVAYINADGRVSRGASSLRYKTPLDDPDTLALGDVFPALRAFTMKGGDGKEILGHFAEELAESEDLQRFVVYAEIDGETVPDSIDFIQLLLVQTAQLNARLNAAEARVADLEGREAA